MPLFSGYGQVIESARPIPGMVRIDEASEADLRIEWLAPQALPPLSHDAWSRTADGLTWVAPGVARYHCRPDSIEVRPDPGARDEDVTALLISTALPAAMWQQGHFVLHATGLALSSGGPVVAIGGPSGSGKSTVAQQLLDGGAALVGDDTLRIDTAGNISGLPGGLFIPRADPAERDFVATNRVSRGGPLRAIIFLGKRTGDWAIRPLDKVDALAHILALQHRPRIPALLGRRGAALRIAADLVRRVPVFIWHRRSGAIQLESGEHDALGAIAGNAA